LMMRMTKTREIYAQAKGSLAYHLASTIIIGLVICTLVYFLIKKLVVGRLVRLADQVSQIDISSEPARRVDALGTDELAFLADSINKMLDHLVQAQQELQESINHIKTLRGIVPICAHCKNIKDNKGYWKQVEAYIEEHTEAEFSHSLCEKCMRELYPELAEEIMGEEVPPGENKNRE
jgi:methyl-accepting chemotaxis protein